MVALNKDFLEGYAYATNDLGREGDIRGLDWSAAYQYLAGRLLAFEPEKPREIAGIQIVVSAAVAPDTIEFHHADGRVDRVKIGAVKRTPRQCERPKEMSQSNSLPSASVMTAPIVT